MLLVFLVGDWDGLFFGGNSNPGIPLPLSATFRTVLGGVVGFGPRQPGPKQVPNPQQNGHHDLSQFLVTCGLLVVAPTPTGLSRKWNPGFERQFLTVSFRQKVALVSFILVI